MYDTSGSHSVCAPPQVLDADTAARLRWLEAALASDNGSRAARRRAREEEQSLAFQSPITTREAFAWFGTFLGLFPPAAIFCRLLWRVSGEDSFAGLLALAVLMNVICCAVGRAMAIQLSGSVDRLERSSWVLMAVVPALLGFVWALVTGAAGGLLFFGVGALFGAVCAVPAGMLGFGLFAPLHRLLARGGMIEERHLWPLAYGVNGLIVALILSPHVFPY